MAVSRLFKVEQPTHRRLILVEADALLIMLVHLSGMCFLYSGGIG